MAGGEFTNYLFVLLPRSWSSLSRLPFRQRNMRNGQPKFVREDYSGPKVANNTKLSNLSVMQAPEASVGQVESGRQF